MGDAGSREVSVSFRPGDLRPPPEALGHPRRRPAAGDRRQSATAIRSRNIGPTVARVGAELGQADTEGVSVDWCDGGTICRGASRAVHCSGS